MNIMDFMWFAVQFLFAALLIVFICGVFVNFIGELMHKREMRIKEEEIAEMVENAIMNNDYEIIRQKKEKDE